MTVSLDLEEALRALEGAVSAHPEPPSVRRAVALHADFWRFHLGSGPPLSPWSAVFPAASLTPGGLHLLLWLVGAAKHCEGLETAARRAADRGLAPESPFLAVCCTLERAMTPAEVRAEPSRREALLRVFAATCGVSVLAHGRLEPPDESARALERLDPRPLAAQERALGRQMRLLEATREANALIATGGDLPP